MHWLHSTALLPSAPYLQTWHLAIPAPAPSPLATSGGHQWRLIQSCSLQDAHPLPSSADIRWLLVYVWWAQAGGTHPIRMLSSSFVHPHHCTLLCGSSLTMLTSLCTWGIYSKVWIDTACGFLLVIDMRGEECVPECPSGMDVSREREMKYTTWSHVEIPQNNDKQ